MRGYNVVVIGAGSGGLVVAAGAAGLGARAALLEKHKMGGDCLNYGCVPSKALLRAAKAARASREAGRFGIRGISPAGTQDVRPILEYVRACRAHIAPHDSVERFTGLGVDVRLAAGRLKSRGEVEIGTTGEILRGRHVVIATGSRPRVPEIPGLAEAGYLTNETVFDVETLPPSLVVIGGGPIGVELGQAFSRLGSRVTVVSSSPHILPREDADAAEALAARLNAEGVTILDGARATGVETRDGKKTVRVSVGEDTREVEADAILVAAGRLPNVEGLGLEGAGVAFDGKGIRTDAACRTSAKNVWAIGDVAHGPFFTHWAGHQARTVIRNVLFPLTAKFDRENLPWATFTDPEVARVGLSETEAKEEGIEHRVFRVEFSSVDRAVCDGEHEGLFAKALADRKGRILGATIVHAHAGDLLAPLVLAKKHGLTLKNLSSTIHTYPTLSEVNRALGDAYMRTTLTPTMKERLTKVYGWLRP